MLKPEPDVIEGIKDAIPYFLIGDLPSQHLANERVLRALTEAKQLYNYRQSWACLPTENDSYCEVAHISESNYWWCWKYALASSTLNYCFWKTENFFSSPYGFADIASSSCVVKEPDWNRKAIHQNILEPVKKVRRNQRKAEANMTRQVKGVFFPSKCIIMTVSKS